MRLTLILMLALTGCAASNQLPEDFDPTYTF
jgi:hypothetical protein